VLAGAKVGGQGRRAREPDGFERWRCDPDPRGSRFARGRFVLDPTRAFSAWVFPGNSPADPGSSLPFPRGIPRKARESTAGPPGSNRPSGRGDRIRGVSREILCEPPGDGPGGGVGDRRKAPARPPRPPQETREADMRGEGIEKAKGPRSGMSLRGEDEPPRGGRHRPQG
jgi:hypothetical protein